MLLAFLLRNVGPAWNDALRGRGKAHEARHGRRTLGPQHSLPVRQWLGLDLDTGIRLKPAREGVLGQLLPIGGSYQVPQKLAASHILLMGNTGSGKTTTLAVIREGVERDGYTGEGFAPTSRAAQKLAWRPRPSRRILRRPAPGYRRAPAVHRRRELACFYPADACLRRAASSE